MSTNRNDLILRIGGEGGEGVISTGDLIARACARGGLEVYTFKTFPAEVKGGYAMYQVRIGAARLHNPGDTFDVFCAFNGEAWEINRARLKPGDAFVYDSPGDFEPEIPAGVHAYPIAMTQAAKALGAPKAKNMVALGALIELFGLPQGPVEEILTRRFRKKGDAVISANLAALARGIELARTLGKSDPWHVPAPAAAARDTILLTGNDAVGLGALLARAEFFSAYPITPATEIAKYVATHLPKRGGTLIQAEDEIASIAQVVGASYAGKRAMTATSGPGLSLMSEMLGMAVMSETPCVVVDVQRGGPATGMPTKHEQSDLFLAVHGTHGDAARIVLSVEDVRDCIDLTVDAFNIAEEYQNPVILMSDGSLGFSTQTLPYPDPDAYRIVERRRWDGAGTYRRYARTDDGVSPMVDPGTPGAMHMATGLEHSETGAPAYAPANRAAMQQKRFAKLDRLVREYPAVEIDGADAADVGIIAWGSTIGVVREAVARLRADGRKVKGFYPKLLWPMPVAQYEAFAATCGRILLPEVNYQGQLAHFVRAETRIRPESYTICGGLPFTPAQIVAKVQEML